MSFETLSTLVRLGALFVILIVTVYNDLSSRRIPNWLINIGFAVALLLALLPFELTGFLNHLFAFIISVAVFFTFYLFSWVGAGDAKLFALIAFLMGAPFYYYAFFYTCIVGGIIGLSYLGYCFLVKKPIRGSKIPYGTAIAGGALWTAAITYII